MTYKRLKKMFPVYMVISVLIILRLIYIFAVKGPEYREKALKQYYKSVTVSKKRGDICDRNGIPFTGRKKTTLSLTKDGILVENVNDGVFSFSIAERSAVLATHLNGYVSSDYTGADGIEKTYDSFLKNTDEVDLSYRATASGNPLGEYLISESQNTPAGEVRLCLDYHIQKLSEAVMDKYIKKGAVVIIDTKTFDVVSIASRPEFDDKNTAAYENSTEGEFLNRALMGYNAGSVFKIITASAALEKDMGYAIKSFECTGSFDAGEGRNYACHKKDGHGSLIFGEGFARSCNCCFYKSGLEIGASDIVKLARDFGMGNTLLEGNFNESSGNLPQGNEFSDSDTLNISIGQGEILITPLQCAMMTAIIANGGVKKDIRLIHSLTANGITYKKNDADISREVISPETATWISSMMRNCVLYGTGSRAADASVSIAGKTGSAESGWMKNGNLMTHGWFCGFFPYENPRYAMAILAEDGKSGAESCVEPFVEIAEGINEIYPFE